MATILRSFALFASLVGAARFINRRRRTISAETLGAVDALYSTGAPAVAEAPLRNAKRADGCFPGMRYFTKTSTLLGPAVDFVPMLPYLVGYVHPMYRAMQLDMKGGEPIEYPCSEESQMVPSGIRGKISLHGPENYIEAGSLVSDELGSLMTRVARESENQNFTTMKQTIENLGWRVAAREYDEGALIGGPQVSHIWQHPDTLECMVTFQGSASIQDWFANLNADKVDFCGLPHRVHEGFKKHLLMMVTNAGWQAEIRPLLGKCSKVYAVGQSLGAAKATLFAACVNSAPLSGPGYEDFRHMFWNKETPVRLPYL